MSKKREVVIVLPKHIKRGIAKYGGQKDEALLKVINSSGLNYTPYLFTDGRVLLLMPEGTGGLLYSSVEALYSILELGK